MADITETLLTDIKFKKDTVRRTDVGHLGDIDTISGLENLKDALFRRLVTVPGSVVHRPEYGVGLPQFQNAPNTVATRKAIALRIGEQFAEDVRVEEVTAVDFESGDLTPETLKITVKVKVVGYGETEMTFIPFGEVPN